MHSNGYCTCSIVNFGRFSNQTNKNACTTKILRRKCESIQESARAQQRANEYTKQYKCKTAVKKIRRRKILLLVESWEGKVHIITLWHQPNHLNKFCSPPNEWTFALQCLTWHICGCKKQHSLLKHRVENREEEREKRRPPHKMVIPMFEFVQHNSTKAHVCFRFLVFIFLPTLCRSFNFLWRVCFSSGIFAPGFLLSSF